MAVVPDIPDIDALFDGATLGRGPLMPYLSPPLDQRWPPARVAQLRALVENEGATSGQIALRMGCSRNAIIGKCNRLGLRLPNATGLRARPYRRRKPKPPVAAPRPTWKPTPRRAPAEAAQEVFADRVSIFELSSETCRWPLWALDVPFHEKFYCGGWTIEGSPYCAGHARLCYAAGR
jgi:GcrA cell cycle regulator